MNRFSSEIDKWMMSENGSQYIYQQQTDGSKSFEKWKKERGVSEKILSSQSIICIFPTVLQKGLITQNIRVR